MFRFAVIYLLAQQPAFSKLGIGRFFKFLLFSEFLESKVVFFVKCLNVLQELRRSLHLCNWRICYQMGAQQNTGWYVAT